MVVRPFLNDLDSDVLVIPTILAAFSPLQMIALRESGGYTRNPLPILATLDHGNALSVRYLN